MNKGYRIRVLGVDLPAWIGQMLSALGITTVIYGILRYTFLGEYFERVLRNMVGVAPVEVLAGVEAKRE
jgi:hypothetical protein